MKKFFESIFTFLFAIIIVWGETGGLYHTYTRHRDQFWLAVFVPPLSWYRGVEMFWHKEYSGKRWEKRKLNDAVMLVYLFNASFNESENKVKINDEIEDYSLRIAKYPKANKEIIRAVFNDYAQYQTSIYDDLIETLRIYANSGTFKRTKSEKTKEAETILINHGLGELLDLADKALDLFFADFENDADESAWIKFQSKYDEFSNYLNLVRERQLLETNRISRNIFD